MVTGIAERIRLKRVYEAPAPGDGARVLVERLWPRGLSKAAAALDLWDRDIAPSPELRRWYAHDLGRWPEFKRRYQAELAAHPERLAALRAMASPGPLTLLLATRDPVHSSAAVLRDRLVAGDGGDQSGGLPGGAGPSAPEP